MWALCIFWRVYICRWSQYGIWNVTLPMMAASEQAIHREHFVLSAVPASYLEKLRFQCLFLTKKAHQIKVCFCSGLQKKNLHRASVLKLPNPSTFHIKNFHMLKRFWVFTHSCWAFLKVAPSVRMYSWNNSRTAEWICRGMSFFLLKVGQCQRIAEMKSARAGVVFQVQPRVTR